MRTLVISDLHLGARRGNDVLRRRRPLERLLEALEGSDRLVLLGDAIELMEGRARQAFAVATPVLRAVGAAVGADREIVIVAGNHDRPLVRRWARAQGSALRPDSAVPRDASPALATMCSLLAPARISVRYPGVWLAEGTWATHGHYLDRYLVPASPVGIRGRRPRLPEDPLPIDYEQVGRPSLTRSARWLPRPLAALLDDVAELARAATMPAPGRLLYPRFAPLNAMILGVQLRRASLPALMRVLATLRIDADRVVFGHVHRLGPLPGEDLRPWQGQAGRPQLFNSGSWLYEPVLVHRAQPPHPYWPGGAVVIEDDGEPRATGLLDELPERELIEDEMAVAELVP